MKLVPFSIIAIMTLSVIVPISGYGNTYHDTALAASEAVQADMPGVPEDLVATPENGRVLLNWNAPTIGGSISVYVVQYRVADDTSSVWKKISVVGGATSTLIVDLTNGISYDFRVAAINRVGMGDYSIIVRETPGSTAPPPEQPEPPPTDNTVTLNISAFNDINLDGIKDADESAASSIILITYVPDTDDVDILVTGTDGTISKTDLPASYTFWAISIPPDGKLATTPSTSYNGVTYSGLFMVKDPVAGSSHSMSVGIGNDPCLLFPPGSIAAILLGCE